VTELSPSRIRNWRELSPQLATAGQPSAEQLAAVAAAGYRVVINLGLTGTDYALSDEAGLVASLGMEYVHIPVAWEGPTSEDVERFAAALREAGGKRVFVHCAANKRVSVFVALYRIRELGWPVETALAAVRDVWEPNAVWARFIEQLLAEPAVDGR
jgi:uncharacterized protein (TIGR01244 family)